MGEIRVLIVDDERLLLKSMGLVLEKRGFDTLCARDGEEGLRMAGEEAPDIILLDIMMPGMDGWQVLSILKEDNVTKGIPVVMLTAKEYSDGKALAVERGADDFVSKPFELKALCELISKLAQKES